MSIWYVYIVQLKNQAYYTGITNDISKRMKTHRSGKGSKYVRANLPLRLVYFESAENRSAATKREIEIKKFSRKKKIELINKESRMGCGNCDCDKECEEKEEEKECNKDGTCDDCTCGAEDEEKE